MCEDVLFSSLSLQSVPTHIPALTNKTRILTSLLMMSDNALNPNHDHGGLNEADNCNTCIKQSNTNAWIIYIHIYILFLVLLFHLNISTVKKAVVLKLLKINVFLYIRVTTGCSFSLCSSQISSWWSLLCLHWISLAISSPPTLSVIQGHAKHLEGDHRNVIRQDFSDKR